jgi:biotin-(acetyl-CoA carboxylase) ligase
MYEEENKKEKEDKFDELLNSAIIGAGINSTNPMAPLAAIMLKYEKNKEEKEEKMRERKLPF